MIYDMPAWWSNVRHRISDMHTQAQSVAIYGRGDQAILQPGSRWVWDLDFPAHDSATRQAAEAFFFRLNGMQHRVRIHDLSRPTPLGTINLSGVVMQFAAVQFAESVSIHGCGANTTLLAGDWLGVSGQLFMAVEDVQANPSGQMTVPVRWMLRAPLAAGAVVTLDAPSALFSRAETSMGFDRNGEPFEPEFSAQFIERFSP